jgi:phosphate transport system substrate-binding protein
VKGEKKERGTTEQTFKTEPRPTSSQINPKKERNLKTHLGKRRFILLMSSILAIGLVLSSTSCASSPAATPTGLSGTITEAGSTSVQPLAERLANVFMQMYPKVTVTIQGGGSSVGITSADEGTVDIGAASRELKPSEPPLVKHLLARDGIAIVTPPANTVTGLTKDEVRRIFAGEVTNWSQVGGADAEIIVIAREEGSGTRGAFEEMVMGEDLITSNAILQLSNGAVRTTVSTTPNSIGFLSFGYLDTSVKALAVDGVEGTVENAKNGSYPIVRPLYFLTKEAPTGLVKEFIDFCLSAEGQSIVTDEGFIPVD